MKTSIISTLLLILFLLSLTGCKELGLTKTPTATQPMPAVPATPQKTDYAPQTTQQVSVNQCAEYTAEKLNEKISECNTKISTYEKLYTDCEDQVLYYENYSTKCHNSLSLSEQLIDILNIRRTEYATGLPSRISTGGTEIKIRYNKNIEVIGEGFRNNMGTETGSMKPALSFNDYVIVYKPESISELNVGDIIAFDYQNINLMHRVIKIENNKITTAGDASFSTEEITFSHVHYKILGIIYGAHP